MACTYTYKGKTYSTDRLLRVLVSELPSKSQQESVDFLKEYLGMTEDEIIIVKGLIDNRSLGRFKADGKILLSDLADPDVAYHEAFHRVWRMYLTSEERLQAIKELKSRKNISSLIAAYKNVYPTLAENELLEEIMADEFYDYQLNSNFKTSLPLKTFFKNLVDFIKRLLGLKPEHIQMIYDKILAKKYKGSVKSAEQYLRDADKILIGGHEFSIEEKNELIQVLTQRFVKGMIQINGDVKSFTDGGSVKIRSFLDKVIIPSIGNDLLDLSEDNGDIVDALYADTEPILQDNTTKLFQSVFIEGLVRNLKLIGLTIKDEAAEDSTDGALDEDNQAAREFTPSVEIDPKSKMGAKIKLLLSSFSDPSNKTPRFGLDSPISWTKAFMQIGSRMMGVPSSVFREELKLLNIPYVKDLLQVLDKDLIFANEFITTMSLTENKFFKIQYKEGGKYFYDANSGTKKDTVLNEWRNSFLKQVENWDSWKDEVKKLNASRTKVGDGDIADLFGFGLNPDIPNVRATLLEILNKVDSYKGEKPESLKLFKDLGINKLVNDLAAKQTTFEDLTDLMVNLGGKKLYLLGLNTQQTRIINNITYAQTKFIAKPTQDELDNMTSEERLLAIKKVDAQNIEILKQYAPAQVSEFNVTKQEDGTYIVHNKWLDKILDGERLDLIIPYMMDTQSGKELEISKLNEADLYAMHLNGALHGINMSMKHSDRGTFFAYNFGDRQPLYGKTASAIEALSILESNLIEQINLERKFALKMQDRSLPIQNIGKGSFKNGKFVSEPGAFFSDILSDKKTLASDWETFLETGVINESKVKSYVLSQFKQYKQDLTDNGLLDTYQVPIYKNGKREGNVEHLKGIDQDLRTSYGSLDLLLATAFVNETSSHIFETRFFSGDVKIFKNGTDLFKRLSPQSSNGKVSVNDSVTHELVSEKLNQDFEILNPVTGKMVTVNPASLIGTGKDKFFRAVTGAERENYKSHLLEAAVTPSGKPIISKLTGKQESKLFLMFEYEFLQDFPDKSIDELKTQYQPKFELYEAKYDAMNENDGISYMSLVAFKKFMLQQGNWTDGMELVFQTEMKIAQMTSMKDIANMEITLNDVTFKPFQIKSEEIEVKGVTKKVDGWKKRVLNGKIVSTEALHTLKTQYGGYSTPEEYYDDNRGQIDYWFNSIFKTSQHLLLPSAILGTNLQLMNFSLLSNGIDIYHMGSANKVGGVDAKLAAKIVQADPTDSRNTRIHLQDISERGLDFYDKNGYFNHEALTENLDILSYLADWSDLKDQVKIGNKVKDEIKGSTQSLKIMLSNLIVNGNPRFDGAKELVEKYKELIATMVLNNHDKLLARIGFNIDTDEFDSLDKLKRAILDSSQMQAAPDNIRNAVENFFDDPEIGLEVTPMKNKIENVLYSLITNGIISFDRPGSSYPQTPVTGYETLGSRKMIEGTNSQTSNQNTLKFYDPIFDEDGNVVGMNPAEIMVPLPDHWIKPLLKWAKTNNLVLAIEKLNADIANRPDTYQVKGLRIPNQQLSSNDIFQIKKFNLPTMQNYIVIPSEMVIKTGGDFDIDKLNIYWGDIDQRIFGKSDVDILDMYDKYVETAEDAGITPISFDDYHASHADQVSLDEQLLNYEKEILLHPRNAHHLLMPLTDEIFVKDIYDFLVGENLIETPAKSYIAAMLPSTNVKNTVVFVKGKFGVGPVALGITNAATGQADSLSISQSFLNQEAVPRPTKLLFKGYEDKYGLDSYTDKRGTVISEILSQLLTTQVDNVKNPTAVLMNINMQTLGVVIYLIRRGVSPKSVALFLQQPIIAEYLKAQRQNESLLNKHVSMFDKKHGEQSNANLKKDFLTKLGYEQTTPFNVYATDFTIDDNEMLKSAKSKTFDKDQLSYFQYFQDLIEQSRAYSDFQQTQNSDTKGLKDRQALDEANEIVARTYLSGIIDSDEMSKVYSTGVIAPFYKFGRRRYNIYKPFYALLKSAFGDSLTAFKNEAAKYEAGSDKDRVRQTIENDFLLFLVHRFGTTKSEFDRLMKGDSVAKRVRDLKTKIPSNLVLKAFFPIISNSVDMSDPNFPQRIDNLRLFEKELNSLDSNDLRLSMEEINDIDPDLYKDLVMLLMFQSGLNLSPFNYQSIIPVGVNSKRNEYNKYQYLYADILNDALTIMKQHVTHIKYAEMLFKEFKLLFAANNPKFLNKNSEYLWKSEYPYPLALQRNRATASFDLVTKDRRVQPQLGNAYHKQYFVSLINNKIDSKNNVETKDILNEVFEDHQDVPTPIQETPVGKYELFPGVFANQGQTEALDLLEKFLSSNEQEFTLIGRGGTGKTTIIKKVLENLKGRSVMGVTVAHKAKKVLGRSIGKDKVKTFASATANKMNESTGKFEPDMYARQQGRVPISGVDVVIVDEASMISTKMKDEIRTLIQRGTKVIYMGDNAQLPPVGESEDSPVFNVKNQYTLKEKMRQAKTSPIIGVGSTIAENIEGNTKLVAIKDRVSQFDEISKSETVFVADDSEAINMMIEDIKRSKNNPDFVKAVTFNNENHNAAQSVKNLNFRIREKLWGPAAANQLNIGEMLTAYDSFARVSNPTEDDIVIHNSEDFVVKAFSKRTVRNTVKVVSKAKGERSFKYEYDVLDVELINDEGQPIKGHVVEIIADSSKAQYEADLSKLWKEDTQLAIALKSKFANLQYGYAITSHKAQGSTYTNTYVFEDNILGPTNAGDAVTKNKSLYVAVSRPTTKLVMISERNEGTQSSTNVKLEIKSSIVKNNWTKDSPKENPNTAYIFTENINSIGSSRVGGGSAVIRNNPNAIGIVTKKYYVYAEDRTASKVTGGWNQNFQNTEADFELFKKVNLEQFAKIDKYDTKIFPQGFASDLAKIPTRFAEWLQNELLSRYGLVTELNPTKTGLISKDVIPISKPVQPNVERSIDSIVKNFVRQNVLKVTPIQAADKKAIVKASISNKFIGFAEGITDSSTAEYAKQINEQSNIAEPKGEKIKEGVFVNQNGLTKDEQLELFNYLKPYIEEQAYKTNKGVKANKMIGLGLRWDYKSNNKGITKMFPELGDRESISLGTNLAGTNTSYGYYDKSINGLPLGQITTKFRELISKATGIDITDYDGAIINLYDENTFIGNHSDLDESKSAEKYPVVAVNIGGSGNFTAGTTINDNVKLKPGAGYVFGFQGKNRKIPHSTQASKQDGFLPEITTKLDGRIYKENSYRITITMRRVMPLNQNMAIEPNLSNKSNIVNSGNYNSNDVVFVSIPGERGNETIRKEQQDKTIREAIKALNNGATIVVDNKTYIESSSYNSGEKRLAQNLEAKGFIYSEITIDGQLLGVWNKQAVEDWSDFQSIFELDKSQSQYSPSLKLYEGFIKLNHLYKGDEILPFIGESEYYRYLVPMLLKMNPRVETEFTENIRKSVRNKAYSEDLSLKDLEDLGNIEYGKAWGMSVRVLNASFVHTSAPVKTIVHELMHRTLQKEYEKKGEFQTKINELYDYAQKFDDFTSYGFTSETEFLAEAMSNPDFMAVLNEIPYKGHTMWTYLMTLVSDFINTLLNIELKSDSVLAEVVRLSEQVLQNNVGEISKNTPVTESSMQHEILTNWDSYFPRYSWMNEAQKQMTAKLAEEGKITLKCSF